MAPPGGVLKVRVVPGPEMGHDRGHPAYRLLLACAVASFAFAGAPPALADFVVPANAVVNLGSGTVDLACTDLIVAGTLQVASGSIVNARHVTIQAGGTIDGGSGAIALGGDWTNSGQFIAGTSVVRFRDLCSLASASVNGNTTFATASFVTATGKNYVFAVGTTQTVNVQLEIAGTTALPIQFRSSAPGQVGFINLISSGVQLIQHVGVTDVWATGQWLAPTLTNEGGAGNDNRWFGGSARAAAPIPTLTDAMMLALAALLAAIGAWFLRRQRQNDPDFDSPRH
jgi:hypothetical protein